MGTDQERYAEVVPALGGAILGSRSTLTRGILTLGDQWCDIPQRFEYRTAMEVLPIVLSFLLLRPFVSTLFFRREDSDEKAMIGM
jgi:hypothetical protein